MNNQTQSHLAWSAAVPMMSQQIGALRMASAVVGVVAVHESDWRIRLLNSFPELLVLFGNLLWPVLPCKGRNGASLR